MEVVHVKTVVFRAVDYSYAVNEVDRNEIEIRLIDGISLIIKYQTEIEGESILEDIYRQICEF